MDSNEPHILTPRSTNGPSVAVWFLFLLQMLFFCHASSFSVCQRESSEGMLHAVLVASAIFSKGCVRYTWWFADIGLGSLWLKDRHGADSCPQSSELG